ncbi:MAG: class I SAM-dependent methyltransferase [Acidobacteria bacterium]|nr:class I SAM-dependent methyltransferase [Acidobacteriota bacterium]
MNDISALAAEAGRFGERLRRIKSQVGGLEWYPYDTLAVFPVLEGMLRGPDRDLLAMAGAGRVLDIGCGDGDLSFFLDSLGRDVTAIENPSTNYNGVRGYQAMARELGTRAALELQDIDRGFSLSGRTYGLAFCLGVLYHLKNPYGLLETLARHARHCVLSTRIAQVTVRGTGIEKDPVAYLVGPSETNNDATNFWVFSMAGLERILERTGWELCAYSLTGTKRGADPARVDRDQRIFCLLRSRLAEPWGEGVDLDGGWHELEQGCWRWTERAFGVRVAQAPEGSEIRLRFRNPLGPVRLRAIVDGVELPWVEYVEAGEQAYRQSAPIEWTGGECVAVRFELDRSAAPSASDRRELGVQVVFWDLSGAEPRSVTPIAWE